MEPSSDALHGLVLPISGVQTHAGLDLGLVDSFGKIGRGTAAARSNHGTPALKRISRSHKPIGRLPLQQRDSVFMLLAITHEPSLEFRNLGLLWFSTSLRASPESRAG
jgi:hypothetical protein